MTPLSARDIHHGTENSTDIVSLLGQGEKLLQLSHQAALGSYDQELCIEDTGQRTQPRPLLCDDEVRGWCHSLGDAGGRLRPGVEEENLVCYFRQFKAGVKVSSESGGLESRYFLKVHLSWLARQEKYQDTDPVTIPTTSLQPV